MQPYFSKGNRAAAFRQHAKATGRKEGTVAVNYYYAANKRGGAKRGPGRPKMVVAARNGAGLSRIEAVLKSLLDLVRAQEAAGGVAARRTAVCGAAKVSPLNDDIGDVPAAVESLN